MDDIAIWAERSKGLDPTTHFWFAETDGSRYRICDGQTWVEEPKRASTTDALVFVPCKKCKDLYLTDVLHGRKVLTILPEPPTYDSGVYNPETLVDTQENMVYYPKKGVSSMPRISIASFAKFYEVRPAAQVRIVRDIRSRMMDPERYFARDFYWPLRNLLRTTHWATGDIGTFENAMQPFVYGLQDTRKKASYRILCESYVDFWKRSGATYFPIQTASVEIDGLTIVVSPEVGMRIGDDFQALKLWFNSIQPTRQARQIVIHLMDRANAINDHWQKRWHSGIWDVRRARIPLVVRPARDFELGLAGQIAAFLQIWNRLDEEAHRAVAEGAV